MYILESGHTYIHIHYIQIRRAHTHVLEFQVLTDIYNTHEHGIALMPKGHSDQHSEAERYSGLK